MQKLPVHSYPLTIKEQHLDSFGHVNNAAYLVILEEARWQLITDGGFGLEAIQSRQVGPVVLEIHMRFLKELKLRQNIIITTEFIAYERKIGTMKQEIFNEQNERCFEATLHFGLFDLQTRKLIAPTDEWLKAIGAITN